jgi:hypothetical protein
MYHIYNPRSTNGGGKTSLVRAIMRKMQHLKDYTTTNGVFTQIFITPSGEHVAVIGGYPEGIASGGVDRVKNVRDIVPACIELHHYSHILLEGLLMSGLQQLTKDIADGCPGSYYHARELDTPLDACIKNTLHRREVAGNTKPFDPNNSLTPKHRSTTMATAKLALWGMDAKAVSQWEAYKEACELFGLPFSEEDEIV